jgi:hypothetical protein
MLQWDYRAMILARKEVSTSDDFAYTGVDSRGSHTGPGIRGVHAGDRQVVAAKRTLLSSYNSLLMIGNDAAAVS